MSEVCSYRMFLLQISTRFHQSSQTPMAPPKTSKIKM